MTASHREIAVGQIISVPIEQLHPDPSQPRKTFDEESLMGLGRTLASGQVQPLLVYVDEPGYCILEGERRWRAAQLVGLKQLDVLVVERPQSAVDKLRMQLVANVQRADVPPLELADSMQEIIDVSGDTAASVAHSVGLSPAHTSKLLALRTLPESVKAELKAGRISMSTAYGLARVSDEALRDALATEASQGKLTREALNRKKGVCNAVV